MNDFLLDNFRQLPFQLLASSWIFWIGMTRRERFAPRVGGGIVLQFFLSWVWYCLIMRIPGDELWPYVLLYVGYALISTIPPLLSYHMNISEWLFVLTGGYAVQHMTFTASYLIRTALKSDETMGGMLFYTILTRYLIFLMGGLLADLLLVRRYRKPDEYRNGDIRSGVLAVLVMLMAIGVSVYWSYPEEYQGHPLTAVICPVYGFMVCFLILWMCFGIFDENRMRQENVLMEQLLSQAEAQQKTSREAIDIINIKCHDLKHQIRALEKLENSEDRREYLEEIRDAVSIYDAIYHTGCSALDYILREKTLLFNERLIDFDCIAEGESINFMAQSDIYSLMGNILDNALEAVLQEEEEERFISLQIKKKHDMVLIREENRCSKRLEFRDGLPLTIKQDSNYHGFGTRSIRYIAEKYGGTATNSLKNGIFTVNLLLPIPPTSKE